MRFLLAPLLTALLVAVACGGGSAKQAPTSTPVPTATAPAASAPTATPRLHLGPVEAEAYDDPSLPGEHVNLPQIYGGYHGNQNGVNTAAHMTGPIDYSAQGLPPAGGPHWGSAGCGNDPAQAPANCGPVPWGIYRQPWPAESLVHNMEHTGAVIWYNTSDQNVIDDLERTTLFELQDNSRLVVLAPYPDMAAEHIALTVWGRRDEFPVGEYHPDRIMRFVEAYVCWFDPEGVCVFRIS